MEITEQQSDEVAKLFNKHWNDYGYLGVTRSLFLFKELILNELESNKVKFESEINAIETTKEIINEKH